MTERLLHFTLGPVQGFVAQARRTRDLWAGSFLLSWLAGHAMKVVVENGGEILVPDIGQDALFGAVNSGASGFGPAIGSLPNRFKAKVPVGFDPALCREAIHSAWSDLADKAWKRFIEPVAGQGNGTKAIWDRQVVCFWETAWVIGPGDGQDHAWLDRRKNWRTHRPPVEGGDHCMLMGDWQELSGFVRSREPRERRQQDEFWRALKAHVDRESNNPLQLDENERLCAMALIKRLFPHVADEVLGWTPSWDGGQPLRWPSTPRLAATGWLQYAWKEAQREAEAFVALAKDTKADLREPELEAGNTLSKVAGHLLHETGIEFAHDDELGSVNRDALRKAYSCLKDKIGGPSPFYALLIMDGDSVGRLLREREVATTNGLAKFSSQVDGIIRDKKHNGNTIYAGGDDVLALLPLEGALPAALALRQAYRGAFAEFPTATISAALVFAHFHVPLRHVIREAHRQLNDVAKDGNGRDSLAICVLTQGGVTREWVSTWETSTVAPVQAMIDAARDIDEKTSSRFFYAIREQYAEVIAGNVLGVDDVKALLLAEYRRSDAGVGQTRDDASAHMERLFVLAKRNAAAEGDRARGAPSISMEGPLIARFLARERR
ncbi:MAG TPA: type III-B CRISPR-associated protein Cas10/Cmr2 [Alphaproteobacteria bacterium]|nr:type III-B CRISPR-associated protein Cas10/Cmr2 [Alphaproteobacteria bacterium]